MKLIAIITIILINSVCFGQSKIGDATETIGNWTINPKLHWVDDRWVEIEGDVSELGSVISERSFSPIPKSVFIDIDGLFSMDKICFQFKGENVQCFNAKALAAYFYMSMEGKK